MSRAEDRIQRARSLAQTRQERALTKSRGAPSFLAKNIPYIPPPVKKYNVVTKQPLKRTLRTGPQRGLPGKPGEKGDKGDRGEQGPVGYGVPGRDGRDGVDGRDGRDGVDGKDTGLDETTHAALHRKAPIEISGRGGGGYPNVRPREGYVAIGSAKRTWEFKPLEVLLAELTATPYITLIDEALPYTYFGFATPDSLTSDPVWIKPSM